MQVDPNRRTITHRYTSQPLASSADVTRMRINNAMVFCRDNEGIDWIGYKFFGVDYSYLNRGIFHTFRLPGVFDSADHAVRSFLLDGDRILMGTRNGLYVVDQKRKRLLTWGVRRWAPTSFQAYERWAMPIWWEPLGVGCTA